MAVSKMTGAQGVRNLLTLYSLSTPAEITSARASYRRYHELLCSIGEQYNFPVKVSAAVFSALSPNNAYVPNLRDTRSVLRAVRAGDSIDSFKVTTYHPNKHKAWAIACGAEPLDEIRALKTRNFYLNCLCPSNPIPVTVDGHMYWSWMGRRGVVKTRDAKRAENAPPHLSPTLYEEIADAIRCCAEVHGIISCEAQAVLWNTYRRIHSIQGANQMELMARDCFAAGVPDHPLSLAGCGR